MTLPRPVKDVLVETPVDAPISRGWVRIQKKRRTRDNVRKGALAVSCLLLAASVGWAVRGSSSSSSSPAAAPAPAPVTVAARTQLDSLVGQLPTVAARGRSAPLPRPVLAPAPVAAEQKVTIPEPELDVVAALLESVHDAYVAGNMPRATALLSEVAEKHPEDPRAAESLYLLGRIQLELNRKPDDAVKSFTHALELQPPADLVPTLWQALEKARAAK